MKYEDAEYLAYAARSIEYVFERTATGRDHFFADRTTRDAVLYRLQTLTQALCDMSPGRRKLYP